MSSRPYLRAHETGHEVLCREPLHRSSARPLGKPRICDEEQHGERRADKETQPEPCLWTVPSLVCCRLDRACGPYPPNNERKTSQNHEIRILHAQPPIIGFTDRKSVV